MVTRDIKHSTELRTQLSQCPANDLQIVGDVAGHDQHVMQIMMLTKPPAAGYGFRQSPCVNLRRRKCAWTVRSNLCSMRYSVLSIRLTTSRLNFVGSGISEPSASKA